jgi:hypothetical protein
MFRFALLALAIAGVTLSSPALAQTQAEIDEAVALVKKLKGAIEPKTPTPSTPITYVGLGGSEVTDQQLSEVGSGVAAVTWGWPMLCMSGIVAIPWTTPSSAFVLEPPVVGTFSPRRVSAPDSHASRSRPTLVGCSVSAGGGLANELEGEFTM